MPNGNIISMIGSKADMLSTDSISEKPESVKEKFGKKFSTDNLSEYSTKQTSSVQAHWAEAIRENHHFRNIMSLIDEMQLAEGKTMTDFLTVTL